MDGLRLTRRPAGGVPGWLGENVPVGGGLMFRPGMKVFRFGMVLPANPLPFATLVGVSPALVAAAPVFVEPRVPPAGGGPSIGADGWGSSSITIGCWADGRSCCRGDRTGFGGRGSSPKSKASLL